MRGLPQCMLGYTPWGVGLETTPGVSLETSPGQTPQLPPWVWGGEPCQTPQLVPWVWAWTPARHAGIPPAMHAGIPPPSVDIIILTHKIGYRIFSKPAQHYLFCTVKLNQKLLLHEESKKICELETSPHPFTRNKIVRLFTCYTRFFDHEWRFENVMSRIEFIVVFIQRRGMVT